MQPLVSRLGVGSVLPIIDSTWSFRREKSSYSVLQRGVGVLLLTRPPPRAFWARRNPPAKAQEGDFPDFSRIIKGLDGCSRTEFYDIPSNSFIFV